jgi:hypothetical protein
LSKRVEIVICSPPFDQIDRNSTDPDAASSGSGSGTAAQSTPAGTMSESGSASTSAADSTGAASAVGVTQGASSKAGLLLFGIMAFGSAAGMLL